MTHLLLLLLLALSRIVLSSSRVLTFLHEISSTTSSLTPLFMALSLTAMTTEDMLFGKFKIPANHVFYRSPMSAAFVNLRPIVPGHVLVVSNRVVPRISELYDDEYVDLWKSVRLVQAMLTKHYNATAFNVAVQDGTSAGQSVPHVHVHILPRIEGDFARNDDIYDELQDWAPRIGDSDRKLKLEVPEDEYRTDRTPEQMADEAAIYKMLL
jgi:bis(5'-adenosyl)-triphosphatase